MWKTALFLVFTLIIVTILAFLFDDPISPLQKTSLIKLIQIYLVMAFASFVVSAISNNYSQVDKLWSVMPIIYSWIIYWDSSFDSRVLLMSILVTIWGLRLSYNFSRHGGYSFKFWEGKEDYRWAIVRSRPEFQNKWKWQTFNLLFISFYQMGLILLFTLPIIKSMEGKPLFWADYLIAGLFILFIVLETIADQQQWNYQKEKHSKQSKQSINGVNVNDKGFAHKGLWGIVRHPNYASEQAIWLIFYLFSIAATGNWINWSIIGSLLLILLFKGSSDLSETISASKYPEYKDYRNEVPRFVPHLRKSKR